MAICYVFGAGDCDESSLMLGAGDLVIAADGGLNHLNKLGIRPDIIIGDFDSFGSVPEGENIIRLKPEKDVTDMYAAVEVGVEKGFDEFRLFGATGGRFDHTLANVQLVAMLAEKSCKASLINGNYVITALHNGSIKFTEDFSGYISVFAHSSVCCGVSIKGLKYSLDSAELKNSFALGVSNEFIGKESEISVENGTLIITYNSEGR